MAAVTLTVGGRRHEIACRDGEEAHLRQLAAIVDAKAGEAGRGLGTTNEARQLLMAALLLADDLTDARSGGGAGATTDPIEGLAEALDTLAARVETLADALEKSRPHA